MKKKKMEGGEGWGEIEQTTIFSLSPFKSRQSLRSGKLELRRTHGEKPAAALMSVININLRIFFRTTFETTRVIAAWTLTYCIRCTGLVVSITRAPLPREFKGPCRKQTRGAAAAAGIRARAAAIDKPECRFVLSLLRRTLPF